MKVLILAGGYGTRLSEETQVLPKPMVEIGERPILWHIMKIYSHYGFNDFVILLGYKGYVIKEYFANYFLHQSDLTIDLKNNSLEVHDSKSEPWKITLLDTGRGTMTGGRILRAAKYLHGEPFLLTYGDGVADIDIPALIDFHQASGGTITITAVEATSRFGIISHDEDGRVNGFVEKPADGGTWINAGFFVCENAVLDTIEGDQTMFEHEPLQTLAGNGELFAYRHTGFWKCMDTLRDKMFLNEAYNKDQAKWMVWKQTTT